MMITEIKTNRAPAAIGPYSQAKVYGDLIFASGQIPINPETSDVEAETIEAQAEQIMKNIAAVLEAAGSCFENVIKTTCFLSSMDHFSAFNGIYEKYFIGKPARSCVAVKTLPKNVLCEVEFIAVKQ